MAFTEITCHDMRSEFYVHVHEDNTVTNVYGTAKDWLSLNESLERQGRAPVEVREGRNKLFQHAVDVIHALAALRYFIDMLHVPRRCIPKGYKLPRLPDT